MGKRPRKAGSRPFADGSFALASKPLASMAEPAPIRTYYVCPVCAGPHPRSECRAGVEADLSAAKRRTTKHTG